MPTSFDNIEWLQLLVLVLEVLVDCFVYCLGEIWTLFVDWLWAWDYREVDPHVWLEERLRAEEWLRHVACDIRYGIRNEAGIAWETLCGWDFDGGYIGPGYPGFDSHYRLDHYYFTPDIMGWHDWVWSWLHFQQELYWHTWNQVPYTPSWFNTSYRPSVLVELAKRVEAGVPLPHEGFSPYAVGESDPVISNIGFMLFLAVWFMDWSFTSGYLLIG